jgi:hypothetical protein
MLVLAYKEGIMPYKTYKFDAEVLPGGKVELTTPLPHGSRVEVLVILQSAAETADLVDVAASSTDFWDNPIDDREWNNA